MTSKLTLVSALALAFSANTSATSVAPQTSVFGINAAPDFSAVDTNDVSGLELYEYPDATEVVETGILFFYTQDLLDYFEGDVTQVYAFAEASVETNNNAFANSGIGLKRTIAGVIPMPEGFDNESMYTNGDALEFSNVLTDNADYADQLAALDAQYGEYGATYYVALARPYDTSSWVGKAIQGGWAAIVTPYDDVQHSVSVLAHELGHTDGGEHYREREFTYSYHMSPYGIGAQCGEGNATSIMALNFDQRKNIFSDPQHKDADSGELCGEVDVADMARGYREGLSDGFITGKNGIFANYRVVNAVQGSASLSVDNLIVSESGDSVSGVVIWDGVTTDQNATLEVVVSDFGTASPADFDGVPAVAIKYDGEPTSRFTIALSDDDEVEADESFTLALKSLNGVAPSANTQEATLTIESDDVGNVGLVSFAESAITVDEGDDVTLTLTRESGTDGELSVSLELVFGSADTADVTLETTEVLFADGEDTKTVVVSIESDSEEESDESFSVRLNGSSEVLGSTTEVTITVNDQTASTPTPPTTGGSSNSSGGGSIGYGLALLMLVAGFRRRIK
ncbi:Calx-beta domain-containing protein [Alteromonas antoniana]|uniref:Calx-beta domain-containing protein n=1 Tax=Alteromonas antoniana TaxID=2803813 RepID=UPI001C45CB53|nr:Calx-beta domain-containing protein [Alteromonas antoniana]